MATRDDLLQQSARRRALERLQANHQAEFDAILDDEVEHPEQLDRLGRAVRPTATYANPAAPPRQEGHSLAFAGNASAVVPSLGFPNPSKPHPQCLCYVSHVQESSEEFINKLAKGNYDPWLENKGVSC